MIYALLVATSALICSAAHKKPPVAEMDTKTISVPTPDGYITETDLRDSLRFKWQDIDMVKYSQAFRFSGAEWGDPGKHESLPLGILQVSNADKIFSSMDFIFYGSFAIIDMYTNKLIVIRPRYDPAKRFRAPRFRAFKPIPNGITLPAVYSANFSLDYMKIENLASDFSSFALLPTVSIGPHRFSVGSDKSLHSQSVALRKQGIPDWHILPRDWWDEPRSWVASKTSTRLSQPGIHVEWVGNPKKTHTLRIRFLLPSLPGEKVDLPSDFVLAEGLVVPSAIKIIHLVALQRSYHNPIELALPVTPDADGLCSGDFEVDLGKLDLLQNDYESVVALSGSFSSQPLLLPW